MKGFELMASLIALMFLLGIGAMLGGVVVIVINDIKQPYTNKINYEMYMSPIYPPIKYEDMLTSYLESADVSSSIPIKKVLAYAAYQNNVTNVFVDDIEVKTLGLSTYSVFNNWIPDEAWLLSLNIGGKSYVISENQRAINSLSKGVMRLRRISVPIYIDSDTVRPSGDKNSDLPIKVALDFYVQ